MSARRSRLAIWNARITKNALTRYFDESVRDGRAVGRDGISAAAFAKNLPQNIRVLNRAARSNTHKFLAYQQVLKSKGAGKPPREISLPSVRDRVLLRAMALYLNEVEPSCSMELAQAKVVRIIKELGQGTFTHYLKIDVVNFYPEINHTWLRAALVRAVRRPEIVQMFMAAVETPTIGRGEKRIQGEINSKGVPQGLAVSNGLAELAIRHMDRVMSAKKDIVYFRYVDDILILMKGDLSSNLWPEFNRQLKLAGLTAHDPDDAGSKSAMGRVGDGFDFLGYSFVWPRVSVRTQSTRRLEASLARTFTRYKYALRSPPKRLNWNEACVEKLEWHLNLIVSGCVFEGNRLGWMAYFSQIRHHQLLAHLDSLVMKQVDRHNIHGLVPKRFVDSYRFAASRRLDVSGYVPNFDDTTFEEMRIILDRIFFVSRSALNQMSDEMVQERFRKKIQGVVAELERDVSGY